MQESLRRQTCNRPTECLPEGVQLTVSPVRTVSELRKFGLFRAAAATLADEDRGVELWQCCDRRLRWRWPGTKELFQSRVLCGRMSPRWTVGFTELVKWTNSWIVGWVGLGLPTGCRGDLDNPRGRRPIVVTILSMVSSAAIEMS